jgi:hypothetical protein
MYQYLKEKLQPYIALYCLFDCIPKDFTVFEQLMVLDISKIVRVCVEGIYIIPEIGVEIPLMNAFRPKNEEGNKSDIGEFCW